MATRKTGLQVRGAVLISVLVFAGSACSGTDARPSACKAGPAPLKAVFRELIAADNARDLDRVLDSYAEDVVWLPPVGEALHGKASVRPRYERMFQDFRPAVRLVIVEALSSGELGVVRGRTYGHLRPVNTGEMVAIDDKFIGILQCREARWLISHLAWSPRNARR